MTGRIRQHPWRRGRLSGALLRPHRTAIAANTVGSADIINGEVKAVDIGTGELTSADLLNGTVDRQDLANSAVAGPNILSGAVRSPKVANDSLTGADIDEDHINLMLGAWHEVGEAGEPPFTATATCSWKNFDSLHNSAGFLLDRHGFVHLKGMVDAEDVDLGCDLTGFPAEAIIFQLPDGYRPASHEVHVAISNGALAQVNVDPSGNVAVVSPPTTTDDAKEWVSLDGITFRCTPSGDCQ